MGSPVIGRILEPNGHAPPPATYYDAERTAFTCRQRDPDNDIRFSFRRDT
jgi:hypothetical protein